jgi:hypothetical protein
VSEDLLDKVKSRLTLALSLYPVIIGLYAAGFFWELPSDIIGAFSLADFLFKASVVYLVALSSVVFPLLLIMFVYLPIGSDSPEPSRGEDKTVERETWNSMSPKRKLTFASASIAVLALAAFAATELPPVSFDPQGVLIALVVIYLLGMVLRPFLTVRNWEGGKRLLIATFLLLLPVLAGYYDASPTPGGPKKDYSGEQCPIVFAGSQAVIARCNGSVIVSKRSDAEDLAWSN